MRRRLFITDDPKSPVAEAYRTLRTNLQFSNFDGSIKRVAITSPGAGAGKSTTISNLAVAIAKSGMSVCLVDGDLRKPRQQEVFGLSNTSGLTNSLLNPENVENNLKRTQYENLSILTSGPVPPNPSEMLGSDAMLKLMQQLDTLFDIVLYDTPPVGMVTDAAVVAQKMDGVILVCSAGETDIKGAEYAKKLLSNVEARLLGVVLNKIPVHQGGYYKYHYQSYYSGYYHDEPKKKSKWSFFKGREKRQVEALD